MNSSTTITTVDDKFLCQTIRSAKRRLLFMTPGMSDEVASAVCSKWDELGLSAVDIIVDVDPEVCRMGYGTIGALKKLYFYASKNGGVVHEQPGIRIAVLILDDATIIYSPTPLLIESGPGKESRPNAVKLDLVPLQIFADMGLEALDTAGGLKAISPQKIQETTNDLVRNPPQKFDIARKVRVFNSRIEFVEFELRGHMISKRKVNIPSDLLGLAKDEETQKLLHSSFQLIGDEDREITGEKIAKKKNAIMKDYLINLPDFGNVILRNKKEEFENAVDALKKDIDVFQKSVNEKLESAIKKNRQVLVKALTPAIKANTPNRWKKFLPEQPNEKQLREILDNELARIFGSAELNLKKIEVTVIYKGITYETLSNPDFIELVNRKIPLQNLFEEYEAAKQAE
ncbi:MAG: hypothetical protein ABSE05_16125 [Syntrophales bacterium]